MAVLSSNVHTQNLILKMLDEHALHKTSLTCKKLGAAANQDRLWAPFLAQRFIEPAENNKHRLTEFFREYCLCHYFRQKTRGLNLAKDLPADRDLFDQYLTLRKFVVTYIPQASLDRHLHRWLQPEQLRILLDSGAKMRPVARGEELASLDDAIEERADDSLAEIGGLFLKAGAQLTQTVDVDGERRLGTLDHAIEKCKSATFVRMLLDHPGAKLSDTVDTDSDRDRGSLDLLFDYWVNEFEELVPTLLQKGARLSETVDDNLGTLDLAVHAWCPWSVIQHLLNAGARITQKTVELARKRYLDERWGQFKAAAEAQGVLIEEPQEAAREAIVFEPAIAPPAPAQAQGVVLEEPAEVAREPVVFEPAVVAPVAPVETFYAWMSSILESVVACFRGVYEAIINWFRSYT